MSVYLVSDVSSFEQFCASDLSMPTYKTYFPKANLTSLYRNKALRNIEQDDYQMNLSEVCKARKNKVRRTRELGGTPKLLLLDPPNQLNTEVQILVAQAPSI